MAEDLNTITLPSRYGVLTVPADDLVIGRSLATYGEWAQQEIEFLLHFIKAGDVVLDVGACFGTHSLAFSERVGQTGRVLAFEASPKNFPLLQKNCQTRGGGPVELIQAVVAQDDSLSFRFRNDDQNRGGSSFEAAASVATSEEDDEIAVQSRSIDGLGLDRVDFIKIDVEGMERAVIAGASATLRYCAPYIFFEVNFIEEGRQVIELLRGRDYLFFGLLCDPFNPDNFYGSVERIFGEGRECGVLAVPRARYGEVDEIILAHRLAAIDTADDLALLLMNKPQYVRSDITRERAARTLKVPAIVASAGGVDELRQELATLRASKPVFERELASLNERNHNLDGELHRLRADLAASDRESGVLGKLNRALENENNLLREGKGAVEKEMVKLKGDVSRFEQEVLLLRQEKSDRDRDFAELDASRQKTDHDLLLLRDEKSSLARECARLQGAVAILEGELGQLRDLKGALEQDLQLSRDEKSSLEQECAARKGAVAILEDDLSQLRDWKGALERKLAALDKLNHISQEVLDAARTERQDALDGARAERERHEAEIARLGALIAMAKTLARRAGKFPFVLYFGRKRKYRPILVALQSATVAVDPGVAPVSPEA